MASLANLSLHLLCLFSPSPILAGRVEGSPILAGKIEPSPILAGRVEGWQKMGPWVHSLTVAGYARDQKETLGSAGVKPNSGMQAIWLAQAGYSVSDGVQVAERRSTLPDKPGNILEVRVGQGFRGFQPSRIQDPGSRIHSLTASGFAGSGRGEAARVEGRSRGVELLQMESVFQPSRPDIHNDNDYERAMESSRIKQNAYLATRYYPQQQQSAQPKSGKWKQQEDGQHKKRVGSKYLLADPANHTYLKLPMKELLRRLRSNKQLLKEKIMHRQDMKKRQNIFSQKTN